MRVPRLKFALRGMFILLIPLAMSTGCTSPSPPEEPIPTAEQLGLKRPTAKVVRCEGWAIAAPEDWSGFDAIRRPMVLYLSGDGRLGIPPTDGTLAPIQAGLTVEVHAPESGLSPRGRAERDLKGLAGSVGFEILGKPSIRATTLADGTAAVHVRVEILKQSRRRLSRYEKVYCAAPDRRQVVATGFLACGAGGGRFLEKTGLAEFVAKHVDSLCLDGDRVELAKLGDAYASLDLLARPALAEAVEGNKLLVPGGYGRAVKVFRKSLRFCDAVSASHNGLAWGLLQGEKSGAPEAAEAQRHAETAVEQTARRDPAALDTLALAYSRRGERSKAIAIIREAIELRPNDPDLRGTLERYQKP